MFFPCFFVFNKKPGIFPEVFSPKKRKEADSDRSIPSDGGHLLIDHLHLLGHTFHFLPPVEGRRAAPKDGTGGIRHAASTVPKSKKKSGWATREKRLKNSKNQGKTYEKHTKSASKSFWFCKGFLTRGHV